MIRIPLLLYVLFSYFEWTTFLTSSTTHLLINITQQFRTHLTCVWYRFLYFVRPQFNVHSSTPQLKITHRYYFMAMVYMLHIFNRKTGTFFHTNISTTRNSSRFLWIVSEMCDWVYLLCNKWFLIWANDMWITIHLHVLQIFSDWVSKMSPTIS